MKFAKYLESESIPEWRKAYINYKGLKKRLKAVDKFRKANERKAAIELDHAFQGIVDADSDTEQPPPRPTLYKQDTAATNEWRWPWNVDNTNSAWLNENPPLHRQQSFPHSLIRRISSRFNQDDTELARVHSRPVSINSSATLSILDEALLHASEAERVFFAILNGELDKVSRFYDEKEIEARTKLEALKIQMQLIAEYGRRLLEIEDAEDHHRQQQQQQNGYGVPLPNGFNSNNNRQEQNSQGGWFDWITGHHRNKSSNHDASRIPLHLPQMSSTIDYSADHHVSYSVARSRLKKALTEYYRSLEFLRSYKVLNETGFHKIMKKFDKTAGWKASPLYLQRVKKYHWVTSTELDSIIKETETLYINEFADGHRRRGMRKLRVPEKQEDYNSTTLRIGLYLGMALILLLRSCQLGFEPKTGKQLPNIQTNLQIYACFALPILFCLGFSTNLIIWHRSRISYKFIFELDPRHNLNYHQFGELPAFMLLIQSVIMYIDFTQLFAPSIPSELCPLILFVILMAIVFCPFDILYCSARKWLGVALGRIFLSGCFRVEFRDFFIADELNSLAYSFWTLSYFFCAYSWQWTDLQSNCNIALVWYTPLIASLPPWWRLLQCLRRYKDSSENVHLYNAAKYATSILATVIGGIRRMYPSKTMDIIMILTCIINSTYTTTWDIKMDWGLGQPNSQHLFLRDELVFKRGFYYIACIIDIILRFAWIMNFIQIRRLNGAVLGFILAAFEGYRRIQWNVFRLENEHLNNCGHYRAIKEIPLPFALRENVKQPNEQDEGNIQLPTNDSHHMNGRITPPTPIPIVSDYPHEIMHNHHSQQQTPSSNMMDPLSWVTPATRPQSIAHSLAGRDSIYGGSFYGRRDFESRHDREESIKDATSPTTNGGPGNGGSQSQPPTSTINNVLTRIRSIGALGNREDDESDTDREEDEEDDDEDENDINDNNNNYHPSHPYRHHGDNNV